MSDTQYRSVWTHLRELEFRQGYLTADGVRTRYAEAGDPSAPPVLLLHGTGGHWETFAPNLPALAEHFHCVAIDMVGNGFSDKPDHDYEIAVYLRQVRAVLDAFGFTSAALVGMSLGAWVAAALAVEDPERVEKLILMSPAGLVATASNMARIRAERTRAVENPEWNSIKAMFDHLIADEENRIPDVIALRQAIYQLPETLATIDHLLILQDPDARERNLIPEDRWRTISCPTLVVASGKDHGEYQSTARRVAELISGAEVLEMPHVKHWPHFEDPEAFNAAAVPFLRKVLA
ncbi:alpha/beta fold hydrolase [Pseudonocardia sp. KRD291]|uniref:alpha/beta fold hydrolase n=1 Tax=Pseudonocardia sp. KRD291 TaxID=2792007 RepID=UPI001C4A45C3|nr:alpha/beta hydrolase [Pseudonocardia sp. KRD291]MBW0103996.1 alpha/beta hydrolase [Pseudonocardia sp. KRD291]